MKFVLKILILSIVLSGCTDDNNPFNYSSKPKLLLLKKEISENENYITTKEYIYSDNKLITVNYETSSKSSNSNSYSKTEYEYISENEYFKYEFWDNTLKRKYRYFKPNSNTIRREKLDPLTDELKSYYLMDIDNSCGGTKMYYYDNNNVLTYRVEKDFYGSNCSFNELSYDSDGNFKGKYQLVYDNMKDSFSTLYSSNFWRNNSKLIHNVIEFTSWDENNILKFSEKSTFEYNKEGYPTFEERIYKGSDGTTSVNTIYYEYY